ncbi:MAG: site-specific DNA-methyltransferase [Planctomycetota bacterium]|nr:site-specific DNA-methyltransferase [Planctomycetota bacterium]
MPFLQFKGKSAIESYHHVVAHHRLDFDAKLSVLPKGEKPGLGGNLIIEGDNLLALKALLPTHAGRIKCIYIDPPYNTGNEGWVYNDNLTQPQFKEWIGRTVGKEGEDACRHDKWCCMMYPRLELLKDLLREDGAIFISIDDNEVHHLRMIMDEIFGEQNFIADIIWQKKYSPQNDAEFFSQNHDFVVVYAKSREGWKRNLLARTAKQDKAYKNPDNDPRGPWKPSDLTRAEHRDRDYYAITTPAGNEVWPAKGRSWARPPREIERLRADNRLWFGKNGDAIPSLKRFLDEVKAGVVPSTLWLRDEVGDNQEAAQILKQIFADAPADLVFNSPKPWRLVKKILEIATDEDSIVLDSFAGSGTTAHAVLQLNNEDQGERRFVLVQIPYDNKDDQNRRLNICQKITRVRVHRVISGYGNQGATQDTVSVEGLGGSFTYASVGDRLFGEYRDLGKKLPSFEELAKYIFYTETSRECDLKKIDPESGFIGATDVSGGTSYYLLYTPDRKADREMSLVTLGEIAARDKNRNWVIYCEKIWLHQDQLRKVEQEQGKRIRPMVVPFQLK